MQECPDIISENLYLSGEQEDENEPDDIIILHMDIRETLSCLKMLLEEKIGVDLKRYTFWLQDAQILEPHKNLVDQCVKGEGLVQINCQIQTINQRINIVDVLKPTDAALAALESETNKISKTSENSIRPATGENESELNYDSNDSDTEYTSNKNVNDDYQSSTEKERPCLNWVLDSKFRKEQARLNIPQDPNDWSVAQVKHWFLWAVRQFNLTRVSIDEWNINGAELCSLSHKEFREKVPKDPGNVFWTHLQLLKECKFVSVVHKIPELEENISPQVNVQKEPKIMRNTKNLGIACPSPTGGLSNNASGNGNNGQVQLWQFLLEILTDREHKDVIQWVGTDGEFIFVDPEKVARLWGEKKNKPAMNYDKLSRALRYYYDGDMISKVAGKRFAYKFDCDLKFLIGYNAEELSRLVHDSDDLVYKDQTVIPSNHVE